MKQETIGVVDYKAGNLKSIETALRYLEADFFISDDPSRLEKAYRLIFPGVGEAGAAMSALKTTGLDEVVKQTFQAGKPILGICLGSQIILEFSEERDTLCLGIVPGKALRFPVRQGFKIPHMGWNQVNYKKDHPLFSGITDGSSFYFVHSYYPAPANKEWIIGETDYILDFCSGLCYKNLAAFQFHPEKSGEIGLKLMKNFLNWQI